MNFIGNYDLKELQECYCNVIEARHADNTIIYPDDIYKGHITDHLKMHIHAAALQKLLRYFESEYREILDQEIQYMGAKIKWLGKPSHFAYLFKELADKGWIEKPRGSYKGLAKSCFNYFDLNTDKIDAFYNEFTKSASITPGSESFFRIKKNQNIRI